MKVLDELNTADMEIYEHAVKVMVQQKDLLSAVLQPSHCNSKLAAAAETLGIIHDGCGVLAKCRYGSLNRGQSCWSGLQV